MFHRLLLIISALTFALMVFAQPALPIEYFDKAEVFRKDSQRDSAAHYYILAGDAYISTDSTQQAAEAYNLAGSTLNRLDDYEGALVYLQKAYSLGHCGAADSLTFATTNVNLGVSYSAMESFDASIIHHYKALAIRQAIYGEMHADVATSYGNIGNVFLGMQLYKDAVENHLKAAEIREELFGETSVEIIQSYIGLGHSYREMGKYRKSAEYYHKALENKIIQKGEGHADLVRYYVWLAELYELSGDTEQQKIYQAMADEIRKKTE